MLNLWAFYNFSCAHITHTLLKYHSKNYFKKNFISIDSRHRYLSLINYKFNKEEMMKLSVKMLKHFMLVLHTHKSLRILILMRCVVNFSFLKAQPKAKKKQICLQHNSSRQTSIPYLPTHLFYSHTCTIYTFIHSIHQLIA